VLQHYFTPVLRYVYAVWYPWTRGECTHVWVSAQRLVGPGVTGSAWRRSAKSLSGGALQRCTSGLARFSSRPRRSARSQHLADAADLAKVPASGRSPTVVWIIHQSASFVERRQNQSAGPAPSVGDTVNGLSPTVPGRLVGMFYPKAMSKHVVVTRAEWLGRLTSASRTAWYEAPSAPQR